MPTECNPGLFDFGSVEGRRVVAGFDGGRVTSDAGALLLGATDRAIRLIDRFAACFSDGRSAKDVEHAVATLVGQRVMLGETFGVERYQLTYHVLMEKRGFLGGMKRIGIEAEIALAVFLVLAR